MPSYNCRECDNMFDPTEQVSCPSCGCKKPLLCSKCNTPINHHDIFAIEKLKTKRPLLCLSCGAENEVVKCPICKLSQVRLQGVSVSSEPGANVYHKACLDKRYEVMKMTRYAAPILLSAFLLVGLAIHKSPVYMFGSFITGAIFFLAIKMYEKIIEPR